MEAAVLRWLGRFSVGLALFALLLTLADPVALLISFVALILGGLSAIAGKSRYALITGGIVAATGLIAITIFPPIPGTSILLGLRVFAPPYLVAAALLFFGRWRVRRAARVALHHE